MQKIENSERITLYDFLEDDDLDKIASRITDGTTLLKYFDNLLSYLDKITLGLSIEYPEALTNKLSWHKKMNPILTSDQLAKKNLATLSWLIMVINSFKLINLYHERFLYINSKQKKSGFNFSSYIRLLRRFKLYCAKEIVKNNSYDILIEP
ncbi:MAG: hypothetical protein ABIM99_05265 [Candidatus Dojkabacteria bacterium]